MQTSIVVPQSAKVAPSSKSGNETETYFQTAVRRISIIYQAELRFPRRLARLARIK